MRLSNLPPGVSENDPHFDIAPMFQDKDGTEVFFGDKVFIKGSFGIEKEAPEINLIAEFASFSPGEVDLDVNGNQSWIPDHFIVKIGENVIAFGCEYIEDDDYEILRCYNIERI